MRVQHDLDNRLYARLFVETGEGLAAVDQTGEICVEEQCNEVCPVGQMSGCIGGEVGLAIEAVFQGLQTGTYQLEIYSHAAPPEVEFTASFWEACVSDGDCDGRCDSDPDCLL